GALGKGLAGKTKSPVGQKTEAMYKNASARVKTAYNNGVNAVKDAWNNMARMFGPAEYMVTPEGFVVRVQYENGTNYSKSSGKSGGKGTKTSDTKNTNGNSGVKQSGSSNKKGQTKVTVDGKEVILDNDTFDPSQVDAQGRTNTQRMEQGLAPIGKDGKSVNIHHVDQTDTGPVKEILATKHQQNYKELHSNTGQEPSQIDRPAFNKWRKNSYWPWHAKNLNQ
ncbi:HNH/ENDO VII family nuclease, partial [Butyrivibrio sp. INlla14]|uniref:HNH/ENDO VII family nuclease n=1 Tax=Butyrivibrio sp. INlla14 TaxID=1520808 RepID=UPI00087683E5